MKTERGGDVEIGVDVVDVMDPPQQGEAVVRDMPVIEAQVEQ